MITETQKTILKLHGHLYFYLEAQPFYWKPDFSGVVFNSKKISWIKWILGQVILWSYVPILVYVAATHLIISPRPCFDIVKLVAYFYMCCVIWGAQTIAFVVLHDGTSFAQGCNGFLSFETNLLKFTNLRSKASKEITKSQVTQDHILDWIIVLFNLAGALAPVLVIPICLCLDFDGYYFLCQDFFPGPEYITADYIVWSFLIRMVLVFILVAQICRLSTFLVTAALIYGNSSKVVCEYLTTLFLDGHRSETIVFLYTGIYLTYNVIQERLDQILCLALSAIFASSIPTLWVCTKEYGQVDELLYSFCAVASVLLVVIPLIFFQYIKNICEISSKLLSNMREKALLATSVRQSKQTKWELREVRVLRKIKFGYGTFFEMETDAVASYFMELMDKWVTAILLF